MGKRCDASQLLKVHFNFNNKISESPRIELNCAILYCLCQLTQWKFEVMYLKSTRNLKSTRQLLIAVIIIGKEEGKKPYLWPLRVVKKSQQWTENSSPLRQVLIIKAFLMTLIHSRWKLMPTFFKLEVFTHEQVVK